MGFQPKHVLGFDPRKVVAAAIKSGLMTPPKPPAPPKVAATGAVCRKTGPSMKYGKPEIDQVHYLRHEEGLKYKEIAKRTGFPMYSISWILYGLEPSPEMAVKLTKRKLGK